MVQISDIVADFAGNDFLLPYFRRELGVKDDDQPLPALAAVKVVTDATGGDGSSPMFDEYCRERNLPVTVLQCPNIVGTGMNGLMRRMAGGIYKGTFVHIAGNDARVSVVHATDVAHAAAMAAGCRATFNLTDGRDPQIYDLAEAFAYRLGDKRLFTLKPRWAKLWYGSSYFGTLTTSRTVPDTFGHAFPDFTPVSVTEYLKTHVYDEHSL